MLNITVDRTLISNNIICVRLKGENRTVNLEIADKVTFDGRC